MYVISWSLARCQVHTNNIVKKFASQQSKNVLATIQQLFFYSSHLFLKHFPCLLVCTVYFLESCSTFETTYCCATVHNFCATNVSDVYSALKVAVIADFSQTTLDLICLRKQVGTLLGLCTYMKQSVFSTIKFILLSNR